VKFIENLGKNLMVGETCLFVQMEGLVREMQDPETGVPVRSQKLFLTSIPSAFSGKRHRSPVAHFLPRRLNRLIYALTQLLKQS
jgi:hypothetical protein